MTIPNDGDVIRGLGFVALYAGYLEEQIDDLLFLLQALEEFPEKEQRWRTSQKIDKAERLVATLKFRSRDELLSDLNSAKRALDWRNEVIHGRIYAHSDRPDTLKSGRPNIADRVIDAAELYELANILDGTRSAIYRPMILQIPNAINGVA